MNAGTDEGAANVLELLSKKDPAKVMRNSYKSLRENDPSEFYWILLQLEDKIYRFCTESCEILLWYKKQIIPGSLLSPAGSH